MAGARPLLRALQEKVPALIDPPLAQQVEKILPETSREAFTRIVSEYTQALATDEAMSRNASTSGRESNRPQRREGALRSRAADGPAAAARYELIQLVREMARTLSSIVSERRERTEALIAAVEATPEQQVQIEAILRETAEQSRVTDKSGSSTPSPERRAESIAKIRAILSPEQQKKLRDFLRQP